MMDVAALAAAVGTSAELVFPVTEEDTAQQVGSGAVDVLGTPVLVAWLEAATLQVTPVPEHSASVGVHIDVAHLVPSPVGVEVRCTAELVKVAGLRLTYRVTAFHVHDNVEIGGGTVDRVIVDRARFVASLR